MKDEEFSGQRRRKREDVPYRINSVKQTNKQTKGRDYLEEGKGSGAKGLFGNIVKKPDPGDDAACSARLWKAL